MRSTTRSPSVSPSRSRCPSRITKRRCGSSFQRCMLSLSGGSWRRTSASRSPSAVGRSVAGGAGNGLGVVAGSAGGGAGAGGAFVAAGRGDGVGTAAAAGAAEGAGAVETAGVGGAVGTTGSVVGAGAAAGGMDAGAVASAGVSATTASVAGTARVSGAGRCSSIHTATADETSPKPAIAHSGHAGRVRTGADVCGAGENRSGVSLRRRAASDLRRASRISDMVSASRLAAWWRRARTA